MTVHNRDKYFFIDVIWKGGFKHIVPCRGFNLKSQLAFNDSIFWIESHSHYEVTKEQYEEYLWGSGSLADTEKTTSTTTTKSRRKAATSAKTVGKKQSATKSSVKPATKTTKKKAASSTVKKKPSDGSNQRKKNEHSKSKPVRKA